LLAAPLAAARAYSLPLHPILGDPGQSRGSNVEAQELIAIPGPLRSFLRMAGISQKIPAEDVLPELARNVYGIGYNRAYGQLSATEYLVLLRRYVSQARDLQGLTNSKGDIEVSHCADAGPLLLLLGYRMRGACGQKDLSLEPSNPENAFLTVDAGFPLTRLEEALQTDVPFVYNYTSSRVPVLLHASDWRSLNTSKQAARGDLIDVLLHDPQVAELYWAFSKIDRETGSALRQSGGLVNLLPYASVLDFYGTQLCIRGGRVIVPGGPAAESGWRELVGASPSSPAEFVRELLIQDRGWMALFFDTLARVDKVQQAHLTQAPRLRRLYSAFLKEGTKASAAGASFRKAPGLLLLFARQEWQTDGQPRIPGGVELWRPILGKYGRRSTTPEQVLEAMVACSRLDTEDGPLQVYLSLNALDGARTAQQRVTPETLALLASSYSQFSSWYTIFTEFPELNDRSIHQFIHVANSIDHISNTDRRGDALGIFQANLGLWQILARQGGIARTKLNESWEKVVSPFADVESSAQLYSAGEKSLDELMVAAAGRDNLSQNELVDLLAGPAQKSAAGKQVRSEVARRMRLVMDDQRLTPLETILELGHGLSELAHGAGERDRVLSLAADLRQFEMPRRIFTEGEKVEWAPGVLSQQHAELEMRTDLVKIIQQANSPEKLESARGQLAPFLRDTLVGLNYAYYEPAGSQILHINPLFVRCHDFAGSTVVGEEHVWHASSLFGTGVSAGGGAYLVGSLADLPYVLAAAEQNFIAPENVQALIWQELVPSLLANATMARWWNVSPRELHAVALYQRAGEEIVAVSAGDAQIRDKALAILAERMSPQSLERLKLALLSNDTDAAIRRLMPADTFYLAVGFREHYPQESQAAGAANKALDKLVRENASDVSLKHISHDFGIPHPVLAQTYGRELVNLQPFPAFEGYCNRLLGESWESDNLYWARLADEMNDSPETLNILSPQLTRLMVSKIFATDLEDWSAILRAMHETGDELLQGKLAMIPGTENTAQR
jgi:hypothetical protein